MSNKKLEDDVDLVALVIEMLKANIIQKDGARIDAAMQFLMKNGAPLALGSRLHIKSVNEVNLTRLNEAFVFDLPNELFGIEIAKVINERTRLCGEILEKGAVVGLFRANSDWLFANGEVYYEDLGGTITHVSKTTPGQYIGHAVLIYGFECMDNDFYDIVLDTQDSQGPEIHSKGRARLHVSALRGYVVPTL